MHDTIPMTPDELRQKVELSIVELIKTKLADGSMTEDRAQQISQVVLDTIKPGMDFDELYKAIPKLDDTCQEISPIILPYLREYEQNVNQKAMKQIVDLIHTGQYDAAADLGKKVVSQEVELVWQGSGKSNSKSNQSLALNSDGAPQQSVQNTVPQPATVSQQQSVTDNRQPTPLRVSTDSGLQGAQQPVTDNRPLTTDNQSMLPDPLSVTPRDSDVANVVSGMPMATSQEIPPDDLLPDPFGTTPLI